MKKKKQAPAKPSSDLEWLQAEIVSADRFPSATLFELEPQFLKCSQALSRLQDYQGERLPLPSDMLPLLP